MVLCTDLMDASRDHIQQLVQPGLDPKKSCYNTPAGRPRTNVDELVVFEQVSSRTQTPLLVKGTVMFTEQMIFGIV